MVLIDYSRDSLLPDISKATINKKYKTPTENSPQESFARAASAFADDEQHAQRLYDYASKLWFGFASPILSNGGTDCGLPISCFLNFVPDSRKGLADHYVENIWLSTLGGGIGACWDSIRSDGAKTSTGNESTGIIPFMHVADSEMLAFQQGKNRRGKYSYNLHISHPEIEEFIDITNKHGGDIHRRSVHSFSCVTIPDRFMEILSVDGMWDLVDPHTFEVRKQVKASELWEKILTSRNNHGVPYIHYIDTTNKAMPVEQKALGLKVRQTNLCAEITLPTNEERTAVCCLSSVNLEMFDVWKSDAQFIPDIIRMLDNIISYFIEKAPPELHKAKYSAMRERSLGLGTMGWHAYLQKHNIAFESAIAITTNNYIFNHIKTRAEKASLQLAMERGSCMDSYEGRDLLLKSGWKDFQLPPPKRNMHLMAIAPNATSSIICGNTSPSIEPLYSNCFMQETQNGLFERRNPYLIPVLEKYNKNTDEVWGYISRNAGSVQDLEFLSDHERKVFKTAMEIKQEWIIEQASHRQRYVCQSQSLNLFMPPVVDKTYLHAVHQYAWVMGIKTLYYTRSKALRKPDAVGQAVERQTREEYVHVGEVGYSQTPITYKDVEDDNEEGCLACEG